MATNARRRRVSAHCLWWWRAARRWRANSGEFLICSNVLMDVDGFVVVVDPVDHAGRQQHLVAAQ